MSPSTVGPKNFLLALYKEARKDNMHKLPDPNPQRAFARFRDLLTDGSLMWSSSKARAKHRVRQAVAALGYEASGQHSLRVAAGRDASTSGRVSEVDLKQLYGADGLLRVCARVPGRMHVHAACMSHPQQIAQCLARAVAFARSL